MSELVLGEPVVLVVDDEPGAVVVDEPVADESVLVVEPVLPIVLPEVEPLGVVVDALPGAVVVLDELPGAVAVVPWPVVEVDDDEVEDCE